MTCQPILAPMDISRWVVSMTLLTALFAVRVAGQALQRWNPQPWLPPFATWQGSTLDYRALLAIQVSILAGMAWTSWRAWTGALRPRIGAARWLRAAGALYMAGAVSRIAIGVAVPAAPRWFSAWIPASFHLVLAGFVLAWAGYYSMRETR
jgi:hypothetical protein